tara:strand:- start:39 stop:485 length:447 start_codon:yes stop_codon:yes gene_type:complete
MERKAKSRPFTMKSPLKNTGTMLPEVKVSGGKGGKSKAQRQYDAELDRKAAIEYQGSGELRSQGRSPKANMKKYNTLTEKEKNIYRAKAQKRDSATKMKKIPRKKAKHIPVSKAGKKMQAHGYNLSSKDDNARFFNESAKKAQENRRR